MFEFLKKLTKPRRILKKGIQQRMIGVLAFMLIGGFGASLVGLAKAQITDSDFFRLMAQSQQLSDTAIPAERGVIYDRNMTVLAQSATVWNVNMNPELLSKYPEEAKNEIFMNLEKILGLTQEELEEKASYKQYNSIKIKSKIEKADRDKMLKFLKGTYIYQPANSKPKKYAYSGVISLEEDVKRYYPYASLGAQVIGCIGSDNNGLAGLESKYDSMLTGIDGRLISARANNSSIKNIEYQSAYNAVQGTSLVLTLDSSIQRYLDDALKECYETSQCDTCYGIVMDVKTGAILAMSTQSGYDPNEPYKLYDEKISAGIDAIENETEKKSAKSTAVYQQWRNRAVSDTYEPGSVYKVITMAAGLEENVVDYDETFTCTGSIHVVDRNYWCHNHSGHGTETLTQGLMNSCNPFFITIGQRLGVDTFYKYFEAFGFTQKTGIDLSGEASPTAGVTYFKKDDMTKVNLASCSFGQSFQVSAIQMLTAINAVANGGKLMKPYVVGKTLDSDGNVISTTAPVVKRQVISESTSEKILASMEQVSTAGTAKNSYVAGYRVAGKTGTSDKLTGQQGDYIASFAGCAPANNPEISIIIVVDKPQGATGGGAVAAPVAAEVIEETLSYLNTERQYNDSEKDKLDVQVPDVTTKGVSEAKEAINEKELKVRVVGDGDTVVSQMPVYGQYIPQGGVVFLYTDDDKRCSYVEVPDFTGMTISQVNREAVDAGINVKISGNSLTATGLTAYRQSVEKGKEIECGSTVTVYFRTTTGVNDH
ncbi:MAG: PASTA domain-containing protein [Clostridia bacterium]|nr:PASTA domain-containing protein [Clostridia bacterium]